MRFEELLTMFREPDVVLTAELYAAIQDLLEKKKVTEEKELNPQLPIIQAFIDNECARQKQISEEAADDHRYDYGVLNAVFRSILIPFAGL